MARNLAFLALAVVVGLVAYAALGLILFNVVRLDPRHIPVAVAAACAVAAFISGAQFGGRVRTNSPTPWALGLGGALAICLATPAFLVESPPPEAMRAGSSLVLFGLVFISGALGVKATARSQAKTRGADA